MPGTWDSEKVNNSSYLLELNSLSGETIQHSSSQKGRRGFHVIIIII